MDIFLLLQLFFIILLSATIPQTNLTHAQTHCVKHDKILLLELRKQLVFNSSWSKKLVRWNEETDDCCSWDGVGCNDAGHVTSLLLDSEFISGGFNESSSLFSLNYLEELNFSYNALNESQIPTEIVKLTHLTSLYLSGCSLKGYFPERIFQIQTLRNLDLSNNPCLSGTIPQFSQNNSFATMVLAFTNFSASLPHSISNLEKLSYLDLSHCKFTGVIPFTLSNLTQLGYLDLSHNFFTGSVSSNHFEGLSNVYHVDLTYNSLSGSIPISIFTLPSLSQLDLHNNRFSGQVSEFPTANISSLYHLDLSGNRLESPIPNSFFKLQSLKELSLSDNLFSDTFQLEKILSLPNLKALDLSNNFLSLDATNNFAAANQSSLNHLDLSNNKIAGEIPSWIWEIGNGSLYYLNLSCNMLVDLQKPYNVHAFQSVGALDLHSNQFRGELPLIPQRATYVDYSNNYFDKFFSNTESFSPNYILQFLSISTNRLFGPFPTFICNCTYLQVLDLSVNNLSGSIPSCLFENVKNLQVLNLGRNNINGGIPDKFSPNCSLRTLDLSHNNLLGDVPLSLENCTSLAVMNVGNNHIAGNFPCMLPSALQLLVLRSNRFHGEFTCHRSWPNLQIIDIASNNFSGYLNPFNFSSWKGMVLDGDAELVRINLGVKTTYTRYYYRDEVILTIKGLELKLVKIWPEFTSIDFSCNNFHGDIPKAIGELNSLYLLNLSHNALSGVIPNSFGKLRQLGSLDLSMNLLTGEIPHEIARLTFLVVMNVSYNKLVGKIPLGSQIQTFSADSFEGNVGLCGLPLNTSCTNTSPQTHGNVESDREIEWGYVFGAAGYAVGIGSFSWVLLFCRSFRDKYFEKVEDVFEKIFERRQNRKRRHRGRRVVRNQVRRQ